MMNLLDELLKNVVNARAGLPAARDRFRAIEAHDIFNLLFRPLYIGAREINLVEHRHNFKALLDREINVGKRLRFDTLR